MAAVSACGVFDAHESPDELLGVWRTDAKGYERSYLEIDRKRLVIGMGTFALYDVPIERVERRVRGLGEITYELHYTAVEGYSDSIRLDYRSGDVPTLTTRRPAGVWRRSP